MLRKNGDASQLGSHNDYSNNNFGTAKFDESESGADLGDSYSDSANDMSNQPDTEMEDLSRC